MGKLQKFDHVPALSAELVLPPEGVSAVLRLLADGNTVPFIARYRKEATGELDEVQIRAVEERNVYLSELAELVKIDPKAIGVGQFQHDVHQPLLARKLDEVVVSCVNQVGVELNTASAPLLARVAGIGPGMAKKIVAHREANGTFDSRRQLMDVSGLGPCTFEQAAGFLRVRGGAHPLDASAVHSERYELVDRIAADMRVGLADTVITKLLFFPFFTEILYTRGLNRCSSTSRSQ